MLDDSTFATLSSLMLFNNVEVLVALTQSASFFPDLFRRLHGARGAPSKAVDADWVDHVSFLQARDPMRIGFAKLSTVPVRSML